MKRFLCAALLAMLGVLSLEAGSFWATKPYQKWSAQECRTLLHDSPWSQTYTLQKPVLKELNRNLGEMKSLSDNQEGVITPSITYHVSFRSATPVREAFARQAQLDAHYDKLDDAQKKALDAKLSSFLAVTFPDKIVVHVSYSSNVTDLDRQLAFFWQSQTLDTLKGTVFLSGPDGERVEPSEYWVGGGARREFEFAFPRNARVAAENPRKPLAFEFHHPEIGDMGNSLQAAPTPLAQPSAPPRGMVADPMAQVAQSAPATNAQNTTRIYLKYETSQMSFGGQISY